MTLLSTAIRQALVRDRARVVKPTGANLVRLAAEAMEFVEDVRCVLVDHAGGEKTARRMVVVTLSVQVLDIAWAMFLLLKTEPVRTHIVALTMWRPLFETWARAAFFALEASEDELRQFIEHDTVPKRSWPSKPGKLYEINPKLIVRTIGGKLTPDEPDLLSKLASEDWHGFVHGGSVLLDLMDGGDEITSQVRPDAVMFKIIRTATVAMMCVPVCLEVARNDDNRSVLAAAIADVQQKLSKLYDRWPVDYSALTAPSSGAVELRRATDS